VPSACRYQRKRTETTVTERAPAESYRRKENAGGTRRSALCLRFVICRESALILVCTQGVRGSNPFVYTKPHLDWGFAISLSEIPQESRGLTIYEAADPLLQRSNSLGGGQIIETVFVLKQVE
jgi:hypothetical protein